MKRSHLAGLCVALLAFTVAGSAAETPKKFTETVTGGKPPRQVSFEMVMIPGGKFTMGTPAGEPGRRPDEGPAHEVEIKPFCLATTSVTLDIFFLYYQERAIPCGPDSLQRSAAREKIDGISCPTVVNGDMSLGWGAEGRPVMGVSWRNAVNFCKWLSKKTGKTYRLPTEAEREYACRAGTQTAYSFGDDPAKLGDYAWYLENSLDGMEEKTRPVAKKLPNPWGLYDMHGNVKEWVADFYSPDAYAADAKGAICPTGPKEGKVHVARGGSYLDEAAELRSGARQFQEKEWQFEDPQEPKSVWWLPKKAFIGFRVACEADKP